jgi:hypothetical protein
MYDFILHIAGEGTKLFVMKLPRASIHNVKTREKN